MATTSDLKTFGDDHRTVATRRNNLALVLQDLGELHAARSLLEQALASNLRTFGQDHPTVATRRNNLAGVLKELSQHERALTATQEAVVHYRALASKQPGAFLSYLATSLDNLALRLTEIGDDDGANAASSEAAEIRRKLQAKLRPDEGGAD